jgi:predicted ATP-dependent endonuclease of OLD family
MASKFNEELNEIFFANLIILVEGPADRVACQLALETLGVELDKRGISIAECGSNTGIKPIGKVAKLFQIPVYALIDEDPGNQNTRRIITELKSFLGNNNVFLQSPKLESLFGLTKKPNRYESLSIFPQWFSNNIPPSVYADLKRSIEGS